MTTNAEWFSIDELVGKLREYVRRASNEERLRIFDNLAIGYCRACGTKTDGKICHCTNDE